MTVEINYEYETSYLFELFTKYFNAKQLELKNSILKSVNVEFDDVSNMTSHIIIQDCFDEFELGFYINEEKSEMAELGMEYEEEFTEMTDLLIYEQSKTIILDNINNNKISKDVLKIIVNYIM